VLKADLKGCVLSLFLKKASVWNTS